MRKWLDSVQMDYYNQEEDNYDNKYIYAVNLFLVDSSKIQQNFTTSYILAIYFICRLFPYSNQ